MTTKTSFKGSFTALVTPFKNGGLDEKAFRVYRYGKEIKLAKKEFELLWLLVRNRGSVVSRDRILSEVWQMSDEIETRTVDAHIRNLRKKIGTSRIATVVGFGYRYDPPEKSEGRGQKAEGG